MNVLIELLKFAAAVAFVGIIAGCAAVIATTSDERVALRCILVALCTVGGAVLAAAVVAG